MKRKYHDESRRYYVECSEDKQRAFEKDKVTVKFPDGSFIGVLKKLRPAKALVHFEGRKRGFLVDYENITFKN